MTWAQPVLADTRGNIRSYTSHGRFGIRNVTYRHDRSRESRKVSAAIRADQTTAFVEM